MPFFEVPVPLIFEDQRYPDKDTDYIYEHLKYIWSELPHEFPLPALRVCIIRNRVVVTSKHKYLRIARELGLPWIRCVFSADDARRINSIENGALAIRAIPDGEFERELNIKVFKAHHVFFFERPLYEDEKIRFDEEITGFIRRLTSPLLSESQNSLVRAEFPFNGACGQFRFDFLAGDHSWGNEYGYTCRIFSREVCRIVSFNGAKFVTD